LKLINLARVQHELFSVQITAQNLLSSIKGITMSQIKVKNFGPIKAGLLENDGFIDVRKVTIFIGNQGTGKSSIAKLISTLSWLEKALYRGDLEEKYVIKYNRFVKSFCQYQNLTNYFLPETQIEYNGDVYRISFKNAKLSIEPTDNSKYRALSDQNRKDGAKRLGMK
jgi:predicted ATPase